MNRGEFCVRCGKGREWGNSMPMYLGTLALNAGTGPPVHVCIDTGPHEAGVTGCEETRTQFVATGEEQEGTELLLRYHRGGDQLSRPVG